MTLNLRLRTSNFTPVDYSKWQRTTEPHLLWAAPHKTLLPQQNNKETFVTRQHQTGISAKPQQSTTHNDSTTFPKFTKRTEKRMQDQVTTTKNIKKLMLLIMSRREAIKDLEEHCEQLQEMNLQVARSIVDTDRNSLSRDKDLLNQQEQMRRSMAGLKRWSDSQITSIKAELTDANETSQTQLSGLQEQLDMVKAKVMAAQKQLHSLKTYKDMKFPVKALQIADMERQLKRLRDVQQNEKEDVSVVFEKEMVNLKRRRQQKEQGVLSAFVEHACYVPPVVKLISSQNHRMREEIHMHRQEIIQLEQRNKELMKSIRELQLSRPNIRREIFPDVFLKSDKCTPDMDVHLSVPREDLLPI
ncbi:uncharacterized protein C20orf96 homolog isoform X2 [Triplophysa rosa]|uniref:uncharacterized protein C20orf96 homolog isoform X2 n=1 Tax=Triplophysa rosa TaxID=992332 RepID=UPI0025461362|nr:uncharacterized protein C20orf96 homolog isoform X2 [Triplophysa rosa]